MSSEEVRKTTSEDNVTVDMLIKVLREKQSKLFLEKGKMQELRLGLLQQLHVVESKIDSLEKRISAIKELVTIDFPASEIIGEKSWDKLGVPDAAIELLDEAGGYLTNSQIRVGLSEHGLTVDDTEVISFELDRASQEGAPLLKLSEQLWAKKEWADQGRFSLPGKYQKDSG